MQRVDYDRESCATWQADHPIRAPWFRTSTAEVPAPAPPSLPQLPLLISNRGKGISCEVDAAFACDWQEMVRYPGRHFFTRGSRLGNFFPVPQQIQQALKVHCYVLSDASQAVVICKTFRHLW